MKSISRVGSALFVTTLLALSACGGSIEDKGNGSEEGASCGEVAACGGDPTGTWTIDETCLDPSMFEGLNEGCDAEIDISGMVVGGRAEFRADNTYVTTATQQGPIRVVYPAACLMAEDATFTCAQLNETLQEAVGGKESPFISAECASRGVDCACTFVVPPSTSTTTGTWSVSGSILTTRAQGEGEGAEPEETPFCAQGSSLTVGFSVSEGADAAGPLKHYMRFTKE
ncbi:hypothetical protein WME90_01015 [Sorangium sp. So ce375]|uniref:hypothetical protein n=1 Tax=Sorangium sp. So ce375 TaxID=3133306 RepID=UPI003F5B0860